MRICPRLPKKPEDGINYLVMAKKSAKFIFRAYKTAKTYGDIIHPVPLPLFTLLCEYLGERRTGYLFQKNAVAWLEEKLGKTVRAIFQTKFNKDFGINGLRHSFITYQNKGMPSIATMKEDALSMAHSVITHQTYRHITLE